MGRLPSAAETTEYFSFWRFPDLQLLSAHSSRQSVIPPRRDANDLSE